MKGTWLGRYLMGERLGIGGMGEVYLATQTGPGSYAKPVVLKLLLPHLAQEPEAVQMFLSEARLAAQLAHPHIVQVIDLGMEQGRYFQALEPVEGVSLQLLVGALRRQGGALPTEVVAHVGVCLADALDCAHQRGIVHRDVTPHNVLVSRAGEVKLADFGIAKVRDAVSATRPGVLKGKLEYMAPEQLEAQPLDARADVYGAAVTLYQLASGASPFRRDSEAATLHAILHATPPALAAARPELNAALCQAIAAGLAKAPFARLQTAAALRDRLRPYADGGREALAEWVGQACAAELSRFGHEGAPAVPIDLAAPATRTQAARGGPSRAPVLAALRGLVLLAAGAFGWGWLAPRSSEAVLAEQAPSLSPEAPPRPAELEVGGEPLGGDPVGAAPAAALSPPGAPEPVPARPAARTGRPRSPGAPAPISGATGFLTVDAVPWAEVYVRGRRIGETPLARYPMPTGWVVVTLKNPETGREVVRRVRIGAGEVTVREDLR
jgi:eukaryotic-like serine/threonine-protein kinase